MVEDDYFVVDNYLFKKIIKIAKEIIENKNKSINSPVLYRYRCCRFKNDLTSHILLESTKINLNNHIFIPIYKSRDKQFPNNTSFLFNR